MVNALNKQKRDIRIIAIIFLLFVFVPVYLFLSICFSSDNIITSLIYNFGFIILYLLFIRCIASKKNRALKIIAMIMLFIFTILHIVYYQVFSMKIEPPIYLNNKYGYSFSEMKIKSVTSRNKPLLCILSCQFTPRSAKIIYKGDIIYVYKDNNKGWQDNIDEINQYKTQGSQNVDSINEIFKHTNISTENYKIADSKLIKEDNFEASVGYRSNNVAVPSFDEYDYYIFLNSDDEIKVDQLLSYLDARIAMNGLYGSVNFSLYVIKNKEIYENIVNKPNFEIYIANAIKIQRENHNAGEDDDEGFLAHISGLSASRISFIYDSFSPTIFKNPETMGLESKRYIGYRDPAEFKTIIYLCGTNSFSVFGLK